MPLAMIAAALAAGQPAAAPPQPGKPGKPEKVCRESQRELGSRIRTGRVCKTAEQWEAEDARAAPASLIITEGQQDGRPAKQPQ